VSPEWLQRIEEIYHDALERDLADRPAFLAEACGGDEALLREVSSLIAAKDRAADFLEGSPGRVAAEMLNAGWKQPMPKRQLGHYELVALLGAGGMGRVYRARDILLDREVAIKIISEDLTSSPEALARFKTEAKAIAALSHPNILAIYDFGTEQEFTFAVMELLAGETLRDCLGRSTLGWPRAAEYGLALADGLAAAHAKGIVHRDLKPENIFLTDAGQLKILDFGLARVKQAIPEAVASSAPDVMTRPGVVMGTVSYMSPEQLRGEAADAPSDVFSLGCVLYEMVTGRRAFARRTSPETIAAILKDTPQLDDTTPPKLERIIRKCLEKDASARYQHAGELLADLRHFAREAASTALPPREVAGLRSMKRRRVLMTAGLFLAATVLTLAVYSRFNQPLDSIAVLPFVNDSGDPEADYLIDGITESLINRLSQAPRLSVIARTTALSYKGKTDDPQRIGRELNVRAIVTGKLTQRGENLTIQADLIDVASGRQLWGENYARKLSDILVVQDDIVVRILEGVRLRLTVDEQQRLAKHHTENPEAYQLYLLGRYYGLKMMPDSFGKALERFDRAIEKDPKFALAYAGKSEAYSLAQDVFLPADEAVTKAREFARRAVELDENLSEGHCAMALVYSFYDFDWPGADREFRRALDLDPASACVGDNYGSVLSIIGRQQESLDETTRALQIDPRSALRYFNRGQALYYSGQYDKAVEILREGKDLDPNHGLIRIVLGFLYAHQSKYDEAIAEFQSLPPGANDLFIAYVLSVSGRSDEARARLEKAKQFQTPLLGAVAWSMAMVHTGLGDKDQAFEWLYKARDAHMVVFPSLNVDPTFRSLRPDPRFAQLVRSVGLEP
jgi:serine/threonine protein kinase/Tfp pilus assembly protein PilF